MDLDHFLQKQITERKQGGDSLETGASAVPVLASDSFVDSGGADRAGLLSGDMTRGERFGPLGRRRRGRVGLARASH